MKAPVWLWLSVILIISGFLRVYRIDVKMRFIWDEARDMSAIHQMIVNRKPTLFGPYNEIDNNKDFFGVFHYYLMALALWLFHFNPVGPALFTALLGTVSVGLVYLLMRRGGMHSSAALIVSFLYGISPLVVRYQIWPWNPNTTAFFALLFVLVVTATKKTKVFDFFGGILLGLLFQLHYFTLPLFFFWWLEHWRSNCSGKLWRRLFSFGTGFIVPNLSFILFDVRHEFFYSTILLETFFSGSKQQLFLALGFNPLVTLFSHTQAMAQELFGIPTPLSWVIGFVFLGIMGYEIYLWWRKKKLTLRTIMVSVYFAHIAMIAFFEGTWNLYHSAYLWWGVIWLIVEYVLKMFRVLPFNYRYAIVIAGVVSGGLMIYANDVNRAPLWSENMPIKRQVAMLVVEDIKNEQIQTFNIAALIDADTRATVFRYFLTVRNVLPSPIDHYPEDSHLYLISRSKDIELVMVDPPWELVTFNQSKRTLVGRVDGLYVFRFDKES